MCFWSEVDGETTRRGSYHRLYGQSSMMTEMEVREDRHQVENPGVVDGRRPTLTSQGVGRRRYLCDGKRNGEEEVLRLRV